MSILKSALLIIAACAPVISVGATAQTFRDKPLHVLMPFPVGTGPDTVMRIVGERLTRIWKQQVIVENRPGGNGFIATKRMKLLLD